jgi:hypothetical protein
VRSARQQAEETKKDAAEVTEKRKATARKDAANKLQRAHEQAQVDRLEALDTKGEAIAEEEEALTAADEGLRLEEAAANAKEQRKSA